MIIEKLEQDYCIKSYIQTKRMLISAKAAIDEW